MFKRTSRRMLMLKFVLTVLIFSMAACSTDFKTNGESLEKESLDIFTQWGDPVAPCSAAQGLVDQCKTVFSACLNAATNGQERTQCKLDYHACLNEIPYEELCPRCVLYTISYDDFFSFSLKNTIEKISYNTAGNFTILDYWVYVNETFKDIAAQSQNGIDDVRVISEFNGIGKVHFEPNHKFSLAGIVKPTPHLNDSGAFLNGQFYASNMDRIYSVSLFSGMANAIGIGGAPEGGTILDIAFLGEKIYYAAIDSSNTPYLGYVSLNGFTYTLVAPIKTTANTTVRLTGLAKVGAYLFGLGEDRVIYDVNINTATVTPKFSLPSGRGKGFGLTSVGCD